MTLDQCPYDGTRIDIEPASSGSTLLACAACAVHWERNGTWLQRVFEPDRDIVVAARAANGVE